MFHTQKSNLFIVIKDYINKIILKDQAMKVLLVDDDMLNVISVIMTQTELLERGVFLVDKLKSDISETNKVKLKMMSCIMFVYPSVCALNNLINELKASRFGNYTICFSNSTPTYFLNELAKVDNDDLVIRVEEYYADYVVLNTNIFITPSYNLIQNTLTNSNSSNLNVFKPFLLSGVKHKDQLLNAQCEEPLHLRDARSLAALFLSIRRKPILRLQRNSTYCLEVAKALLEIIDSCKDTFNFTDRYSTCLIIDRASDPFTPLLTPWTYQSMIHFYVGIDKNRCILPSTNMEEIDNEYVLTQMTDDFYATNLYQNYGELCLNAKNYADMCKSMLNIDRSTATIEDIKQLMQAIPQTKSLTQQVTKHVNIVSYLTGLLKAKNLFEISQLEQEIMSSHNPNDQFNQLNDLINRYKKTNSFPLNEANLYSQSIPSQLLGTDVLDTDFSKKQIRFCDIFRLCIIYFMKYEKNTKSSRILSLFNNKFLQTMFEKVHTYYSQQPSTGVVEARKVISNVISMVKGINDAQSIYTQHEPLLKKILLDLLNKKLSDRTYPYCPDISTIQEIIETKDTNTSFSITNEKESLADIVIFMVGGATYDEAVVVDQIKRQFATQNTTNPNNLNIYLGASEMINSRSFLQRIWTDINL